MAKWLKHSTVNRNITGSSPTSYVSILTFLGISIFYRICTYNILKMIIICLKSVSGYCLYQHDTRVSRHSILGIVPCRMFSGCVSLSMVVFPILTVVYIAWYKFTNFVLNDTLWLAEHGGVREDHTTLSS